MKRQFKMLLFLLLMVAGASAQVTGPMRPYQAPTLPLAPPSGFVKNRDVLFLPNGTGYIYSSANKWVETTIYYAGVPGPAGANGMNGLQGPQGPQGPKGEPGVCPPCPPSGGSAPNPNDVKRDVRTWDEFKQACKDAESGKVRMIEILQPFTWSEKLRMEKTPNNPSFSLTVKGNNLKIPIALTVDTAFVRCFANYADASKVVDFQLHFENIELVAPQTCTIFYLSAMYGFSLKNSKLIGGFDQLKTCWVLNGVVDHNRFEGWKNCHAFLSWEGMNGGNNYTTQSNNWIWSNNNFRTAPGQFACIRTNAVSGFLDLHNIYEGGDWNNDNLGSNYATFCDDNGSPTVKDENHLFSHVEFKPAIGAFYSKMAAGISNFSSVYMQKVAPLFIFNSSTYSKFSVRDIPFMPTGTKIQNSGSGGRFFFSNIPAEFDVYNSSNWVGTKPSDDNLFMLPGTSTNGQTPYLRLGSGGFIQIGTKRYTNQ